MSGLAFRFSRNVIDVEDILDIVDLLLTRIYVGNNSSRKQSKLREDIEPIQVTPQEHGGQRDPNT